MYAPDESIETFTRPPSARVNETGMGPTTPAPLNSACPATRVALMSAYVRFVAGTVAVEMNAYWSGMICLIPETAYEPGTR